MTTNKMTTGFIDYAGKDIHIYDIVKPFHPNSGLFPNQFGYIIPTGNTYQIEWAYSGRGLRTDIDWWVKHRNLISIGNLYGDLEQLKPHFTNFDFVQDLIDGIKEELQYSNDEMEK